MKNFENKATFDSYFEAMMWAFDSLKSEIDGKTYYSFYNLKKFQLKNLSASILLIKTIYYFYRF